MQATFYTFDKRYNSTKVVSGEGATLDVKLKQQTSVMEPVFITSDNFTNCNYVAWDGKYYFIEDCAFVHNNYYEVSCTMDVLATYKANILAASAYLERSLAGDVYLPDPLSITASSMEKQISYGTENIFDGGEGTFVFQAVGTPLSDAGSFSVTYLLTSGQLQILAAEMCSDSSLWEAVKEWALSPMDSVISCKWLPIKYDVAGLVNDGTASVTLGTYVTGASGYILSNRTITDSGTIIIPANFRPGNYKRKDVSMQMSLPFIGVVDIPAHTLIAEGAAGVYWNIRIDPMTGDAIIIIRPTYSDGSQGEVVQVLQTNIATEIAVSNVQPNTIRGIGNAISGIISVAGVVASGGTGAAFLGAAATGAMGIAQGAKQMVSSIGQNGGKAFNDYPTMPALICRKLDSSLDVGTINNVLGVVDGNVRTIGSLTGYVQTRGFSVSGAMYGDIRNKINSLMDGGVYIE